MTTSHDLPVPPLVPPQGPFGEPRGDELDITTKIGSINVFSDNTEPDPNVTVTGRAAKSRRSSRKPWRLSRAAAWRLSYPPPGGENR